MYFNKLLIPVESQVREFDAKLLFACAAAESGFEAIIGSRAHIHHFASRVRGCVYVAKSMRHLSKRMFNIINDLGHKIVAWDEESLIRMPDSEYYNYRLSPDTFKYIEHLFAWGESDAEVFRNYAHYNNQPIHIYGNPRVDILRPELNDYFLQQVQNIQKNYGDFILINTNFNEVNHFLPNIDLIPNKSSFIKQRIAYKTALLDEFEKAIKNLSQTFTKYNFVVRPHPSENCEFWKTAFNKFSNVHVINDGNVINWIIASNGLISNGCATSIESTILQRPTIGFYPIKDINIDDPLPKAVSTIAENQSQLVAYVEQIINDNFKISPESINKLRPHIANLEDTFAVDKIVEVLAKNYLNTKVNTSYSWKYLQGAVHNEGRTVLKKINSFKKNHINGDIYHRHRFPTLHADDISEKIHSLENILNRFSRVSSKQINKHIYKIYS